jgi:hypothetical protein
MDPVGVKLRDVPVRSGVSKESIAMAMGILKKWKLAVVAKEGSWQVVRLTTLGSEARRLYEEGLMRTEARWFDRFGVRVSRIRAALEPIVGDGTAEGSLLFQGLEPYPDGRCCRISLWCCIAADIRTGAERQLLASSYYLPGK